jgi:hypothetical protein
MKKKEIKCEYCKNKATLTKWVDDGDGAYKIKVCRDCYDKGKKD